MTFENLPKPFARQILNDLVQTGQPPQQFVQALTVGYENILTTIEEELLEDLLPNGFGSVRFILARNGNGKTHLCRDILERASQRGYAVVEIDLTSEREISTPSKLYSIVASHVTLSDQESGQLQGLDQILREKATLENIRDEKRIDGTYQDAASQIVQQNYSEDDLDFLIQWIRGESIPTSARRLFDLKDRLSDRNAMAWIRNLTLTCIAAGATGLIVVLDEAEATRSSAQKQLQARLSVMLDILNSVTAGDLPHSLFLFTGVSGSFDDQWGALKPVRQRIRPELPYRDNNTNPRTIRIDADETGGIPEEEWLHRVAGKVQRVGKQADCPISSKKEAEIEAVIDQTLNSPQALNKRQFIREVAEIVARR